MANKLLEEIKKRELSHEQVLEILDKFKEGEQEENEEEEEEGEQEEPAPPVPPTDDQNKDKPDYDKIEKDITENISKSVSKTISSEIKKQLKLLRGKPPKGEETDEALGNPAVFKKNSYEVIK